MSEVEEINLAKDETEDGWVRSVVVTDKDAGIRGNDSYLIPFDVAEETAKELFLMFREELMDEFNLEHEEDDS